MSPDSASWIAAKAQGDKAEEAIALFISDNYGWQTYRACGRADFDLLLQCEVEVKHDLKARETGNVAIEVEHRGQASGVMTSRALWWAIVIGSEAVLIKTDALRQTALGGRFRTAYGGDGGASKLILVPIDKLRTGKGARVIPLPEVPA